MAEVEYCYWTWLLKMDDSATLTNFFLRRLFNNAKRAVSLYGSTWKRKVMYGKV
jgi:hypothetical protein